MATKKPPCTRVLWRGVVVCSHTVPKLDAWAVSTGSVLIWPLAGCGSYQTSTKASAGTHAGGGAIDINGNGMTNTERTMVARKSREAGLQVGWFRAAISGVWTNHFHCIDPDCPQLARVAAAQCTECFNGGDGLVGTRPDPGWRGNIGELKSIFNSRAVLDIADAIGGIGGAVADAANNPKPKPAPEEDIVASLAEVEALIRKVIKEEVARAVWSTPRWKGSNGVEYNPGSWLIGANEKAGRGESYSRQGVAQVAGLASGLKAASSNPAITPAQIAAAAKAGAGAALDERITDATVSLNVAP